MPTYEYKCPERQCALEFEVERRISDTSGQECPACGQENCQRLISRCAFHLKGGGWFGSSLGADQIEKNWLKKFDLPERQESTAVADYVQYTSEGESE